MNNLTKEQISKKLDDLSFKLSLLGYRWSYHSTIGDIQVTAFHKEIILGEWIIIYVYVTETSIKIESKFTMLDKDLEKLKGVLNHD